MQQILNKNNEDREFISSPSYNLRHKNYEANINGNVKNPLHKIRLENSEIINNFNVNCMRNKFDCLTAFTKNEVNILMTWETKLDSTEITKGAT